LYELKLITRNVRIERIMEISDHLFSVNSMNKLNNSSKKMQLPFKAKYYKLFKHGTQNAEHGTRNTSNQLTNQPIQNNLYVVFTTLNSERRLI
jgi:hypothetical protein